MKKNINVETHLIIAAIIVTYNRLQLLQECIDSLRNQSRRPCYIVVVNNGSTDGTARWLSDQHDVKTITQENLGSAAGFFTGEKFAVESLGVDAVWIMDDDTIPTCTALENLLSSWNRLSSTGENIGWVCSLVTWTDGSLMNRPKLHHNALNTMPSYFLDGCVQCSSCTFVSVLVSVEAVRGAGYIRKEMKFQGDDTEHTARIVNSGFSGWLSLKSLVIHKANYKSGDNFRYGKQHRNRLKAYWENSFDLCMLENNRKHLVRLSLFIIEYLKQVYRYSIMVNFSAIPPMSYYMLKGIFRRKRIIFPGQA